MTEWAERRHQAEKVDGALRRAPKARSIARFLTVGRDQLSESEVLMVATIEGGVPSLVEARDTAATFQAMVRKQSLAVLEPWLGQAQSSLLASFASGVLDNNEAVVAAIASPCSKGQIESQITKLKPVNARYMDAGRSMCCRPA